MIRHCLFFAVTAILALFCVPDSAVRADDVPGLSRVTVAGRGGDASAADKSYTAIGTLQRDRSNDQQTWTYHLVQETSGLRYEISQMPDIDLASFVGQRVEVIGRRRFLTAAGELRLYPLHVRAISAVRAVQHSEELPGLQVEIPEPETLSAEPTPGILPGVSPGISDGTTVLSTPDMQGFSSAVISPSAVEADSCSYCSNCPCGPQGTFWVRGEWLWWWTHGSALPPLVTASPLGTTRTQVGVLGAPNTSILFGNGRVFDNDRNGVRFRAGAWLDDCQRYGLEAEYFGFARQTFAFSRQSAGNPALARPFINSLTGAQDAELVALNGVATGTVDVHGRSNLQSAGLRLRANLFCGNGEACDSCGDRGFRMDLIGGYRYMRLDEDIRIHENLGSQDPNVPASFDITDTFATENEFHGGEVGMQFEFRRNRWWLEVVSKLALGNNRETVRIDGRTVITADGVAVPLTGGLLAQRTNIGQYQQDEFALIPEIGLTLGFQLTSRLSATLGYTFMYWSNVVRPGEQIDTRINPNLLPPETVPFVGPLEPTFAFRDTDLWIQGMNLGLNYYW